MKQVSVVFLVVVLGIAPLCSVAGIKASHVRPGEFLTVNVGGALVPLNAAGATTISFNNASNGRKVLTYSAECSVSAPDGNRGALLEIDVIVNGLPVAPTTGNTDAFCAADGLVGFSNWVRSSITVVIPVRAGANTVSVRTTGPGGAWVLWLGDSSLVIFD